MMASDTRIEALLIKYYMSVVYSTHNVAHIVCSCGCGNVKFRLNHEMKTMNDIPVGIHEI